LLLLAAMVGAVLLSKRDEVEA
ncbi:MAG: NADH-quinone oxidoreductase subunit J, partial [Flavobacterium sp.]